MVGRPTLVTYDGHKSLSELARDYGVGLDSLRNANGLTQQTRPRRGTSLVVPSQYILPPLQHHGIVINLPEKRLYFYPNQNEVYVFPVAIGALGKDSPIQTFQIRDKRKNPVWTLPKQAKEELIKHGKKAPDTYPAGPNNPLGTRAMRLSFTSYLIHGTNRPHIVGTRASAGCITMYPEDIEMLFDMVPEKTQVTIINMPVKWASINHQYWIEAHPPHQEAAWLPTPITTESKHLLTRMNIPEKMRPKKTYNSLDSILRGASGLPSTLYWPFNETLL